MPDSWLGSCSAFAKDHVPGYRSIARLPRQLLGRNPFRGDVKPTRVPLFSFSSGRPTTPFPHPWNYREPIRILDTYFWGVESEEGSGQHNRYLDVPGLAPVLITRDPGVIRAISKETGGREGQFDRDTRPSKGIARATGKDSLLYANGPTWKRQKKLSTPPFGRSSLFQPEQFHEFEETFRHTVRKRLEVIRERLERSGSSIRVEVEPEIKAVMLEMLVNNFFGAEVEYELIRDRYVPALDGVIEFIVRDTVVNLLGVPLKWLPGLSKRIVASKAAHQAFEELTDLVIAQRQAGTGLWKQFKSDAPDALIRSNIKVFLAGALEATTSYASWALSHLARNEASQEKVYQEVKDLEDYSPENLETATYLGHVLDETLRLTPSLYFLPRKATTDTWIETTSGSTLWIPKGTHILLDVWHANRHEDHWGVNVTGHPAIEFVPERWEDLSQKECNARDLLHFGFGHGPRFCPGKNLGQMEVALVVGAFVKLFRFRAVNPENHARAGVSTKPADGVEIDLELRK
ncbi:MAG: cytochrome P450 [Planctomycetota bacterium]|nr:cytochrome P450 [Planctomycetota bacterium]